MKLGYYLADIVLTSEPNTWAAGGEAAWEVKGMVIRCFDLRADRAASGGKGILIVQAKATPDKTDAEVLAEFETALGSNGVKIPFEDATGETLPPSATLNQISAANRNTIGTYLEARGIPTNDFTASTTIADVLTRVRKRKNFRSILWGDDWGDVLDVQVKDIPGPRRNAIKARLENNWGFDLSFVTANMTVRTVILTLLAQGAAGNL